MRVSGLGIYQLIVRKIHDEYATAIWVPFGSLSL